MSATEDFRVTASGLVVEGYLLADFDPSQIEAVVSEFRHLLREACERLSTEQTKQASQ